jgi:hypothetical protein
MNPTDGRPFCSPIDSLALFVTFACINLCNLLFASILKHVHCSYYTMLHFYKSKLLLFQKRQFEPQYVMSNGIEMVCEMASEDSDWSVLPPPPTPPIGMAFERLKLSPLHSLFQDVHFVIRQFSSF